MSRTTLQWGIPFPEAAGEEGHIIYVWMDALTNYISALGFGTADHERFDRYWPADVHLIGKDIVRFHAVYWPAFLMAAGVELPKAILGARLVAARQPEDLEVARQHRAARRTSSTSFGPDPLRYFLLRDMVFGQDSNYSDESFLGRYNSDLANDLGNTLSRALKMAATYFDGKTPPTPCDEQRREDGGGSCDPRVPRSRWTATRSIARSTPSGSCWPRSTATSSRASRGSTSRRRERTSRSRASSGTSSKDPHRLDDGGALHAAPRRRKRSSASAHRASRSMPKRSPGAGSRTARRSEPAMRSSPAPTPKHTSHPPHRRTT